jgi:hypothetical protein
MISRKRPSRPPRSGRIAATWQSLSSGAAAAGLLPCRRRPKWSAPSLPIKLRSASALRHLAAVLPRSGISTAPPTRRAPLRKRVSGRPGRHQANRRCRSDPQEGGDLRHSHRYGCRREVASWIIEFPSRAAAEGWYRSAEYQKVISLRLNSSVGNLIIVDGSA